MAIDDLSLQIGMRQLEAEERAKAPALVGKLTELAAKSFRAFLSKDVGQMVEALRELRGNVEWERTRYLFECVSDDLSHLESQLDTLSESQQNYFEQEWPRLLTDAQRKAAETGSNKKIKRISEILCSSLTMDPPPPTDLPEEMMRIAMGLSDEDAFVLSCIEYGQRSQYNEFQQRVLPEDANDYWRLYEQAIEDPGGRKLEDLRSIPVGKLHSICATLQSYGLLAETYRNNSKLSLNATPFAIVYKGHEFVKYVRSLNGSELRA